MKDLRDLKYVSFEVAKLFETELGYDEESLVVYRYDTSTGENPELICMGSPKKSYSTVAALTLQEATEYIRDKYHYLINVYTRFEKENDEAQEKMVWYGVVYKIGASSGIYRGEGTSYEECVNKAIASLINLEFNDYKML